MFKVILYYIARLESRPSLGYKRQSFPPSMPFSVSYLSFLACVSLTILRISHQLPVTRPSLPDSGRKLAFVCCAVFGYFLCWSRMSSVRGHIRLCRSWAVGEGDVHLNSREDFLGGLVLLSSIGGTEQPQHSVPCRQGSRAQYGSYWIIDSWTLMAGTAH